MANIISTLLGIGGSAFKGVSNFSGRILGNRKLMILLFTFLLSFPAIVDGIEQRNVIVAVKGLSNTLFASDNKIVEATDRLSGLDDIHFWDYFILLFSVVGAMYIYIGWYYVSVFVAESVTSSPTKILIFGMYFLGLLFLKILSGVIAKGTLSVPGVFTVTNIPLYGLYYLVWQHHDLWLPFARNVTDSDVIQNSL